MKKSKYIKFLCSFLIAVLLLTLYTGDFSAKANKKIDTVPPTSPTNLTAFQIGDTSAVLTWTASYDAKGVASYLIYKNGINIASVKTIAFTATGLSPSATYSFYIRAKDYSGNISPVSNTVTVTTLTPPVTSSAASFAISSMPPSSSSVPVTSSAPSSVSSAPSSPSSVPITSSTPSSPSSVSSVPPVTSSEPQVTSSESSSVTPAKIIAGYYASWSAYSGYTPSDIPASKLTHINYAFAKIGDDLKIALGDPSVDLTNFTKLNQLKAANPELKTLISVGGWTFSNKISDAALTDASREVFADSVVAFIKQYHFDGVDIDWEYPVSGGLSSNTYRPEDKTNFTLLLAKLREKLDAQGAADGRYYLLSIAGGAGSTYIKNTELNLIGSSLDYAIVMTYDLHGPWDTYTDFNAPLYTPTTTSPQYQLSVDSCVRAWITAGFSSSKIVLGVPFYGYIYSGVTNTNSGLYQRYTSGKSITYDNIVSGYLNNSAYIKYVYPDVKVPTLFNGSAFITYDDSASLTEKANYVNLNDLAGVSVWELSQNKDGMLLNTLYESLK